MIEKINVPNNQIYMSGLAAKNSQSAYNTGALSFKGLDKDAVKLTKEAVRGIRGNSKFLNATYEEAQRLAEEIFKKKGNFETTQEGLFAFFKKPKYRTSAELMVLKAEEYISKVGEYVEPELPAVLAKFKQALEKFTLEAEEKILKGVYSDARYDMGKKFANDNGDLIENIKRMLRNTDKKVFQASFDKKELRKILSPYFSINNFDCVISDFIKPCPAEILPQNLIFYHGTKKAGKILKNGFTPFTSQQLEIAPREMGAGFYTTPDSQVAACFAGLRGSIIPVKLDKDAKIAHVSEDSFDHFSMFVSKFIEERISPAKYKNLSPETRNALIECFVRDVLKKAGYDAVYMPKSMKGGGLLQRIFSPDVNEVIGRNQSQLIILSPEKAEAFPRAFSERIKEIKLKVVGFLSKLRYGINHPFGF